MVVTAKTDIDIKLVNKRYNRTPCELVTDVISTPCIKRAVVHHKHTPLRIGISLTGILYYPSVGCRDKIIGVDNNEQNIVVREIISLACRPPEKRECIIVRVVEVMAVIRCIKIVVADCGRYGS